MIEKILEILQDGVETTLTILDVATSIHYSSKARRYLSHGPYRLKTNWRDAYKERQKFYNTIQKLKSEGFIKRTHRKNRISSWAITAKGHTKLKFLRYNQSLSLGPSQKRIKPKHEKTLKIIAFDIPEKERHKRDWLREVLTRLNYTMLQRSVWLGKIRLPEAFFHVLRDKKIIQYVHILKVYKSGTINRIQ